MRIQVNLSDNMVKRVDAMAEDMGVSRSALCSTIIGNYIMNYQKSVDILEKFGKEMLSTEDSE